MRLGAELPQIVSEPPDVASRATADDAIELANVYLFDAPACLSPSQELRLRNGMATRADGKWAASRVGDFGGRQGAGKTDTILARILAGVMLLDERLIIYTAHEFPTANEIFIRLLALFEGWDDLGRELARNPKRAHGDQGFELTRGRRILIKTRTGKSGRGFAKADLLVYDEAQHLMPEHVAGSGPAKLAHPNPQSWYAGSGGMVTSAVAWAMRRQALTGTGGRLSYTEHTAQQVSLDSDGRIILGNPDPDDRDAWALANPGLGRWVTEEGMDDMRDELGPLFPREGLCVWEPEPGDACGLISEHVWLDRQIIDVDSTVVRSLAYGLSVAVDGSAAAIGSSGVRADGLRHVDCVQWQSGTEWVVDRCAELYGRKKVPIRLNAAGAEMGFRQELHDRGVATVEVGGRDYQAACGSFYEFARNDGLRHIDQATLNRAVANAGRRDVGKDGAWVWAELSDVDISPLRAATLALSGVDARRRGPRIHSLREVQPV